MLFLSIAHLELLQRVPNQVDGVELRLDLLPRIDLALIEEALRCSAFPLMLTLRKKSHGGKFKGSEEEREALIRQLLALEPAYFDLEYDMRSAFLAEVLNTHPKTKFILSYHNFEDLDVDLEAIYRAMAKYEVFTYKIAMIADSTNDALKMLLFMKNHPKVSMICMGEAGKFARILGVILGNLIDFASLNAQDETAPGQWSVKELVDIYHYPKLNQQTAIYGLIGDPVAQSPGDLHHNAVFRKRGVNAVYVKMRVRREELTLFMSLIQEIGIRGLSVTIPLKEAILPFAHEIDQPIGALNTLLFEEGKIRGINTDGAGALDAIEKKGSIYGKKVVLLGAGGAARSIAFEARARGAEVMIFNRTLARAKKLASETGCKALEQMPDRYDLLINCSSDPMPIDPQKIRAETTVMDIVYHPKETLLLKEALLKKCQVIYGEEMFLNQAERQTIFWLDA